MIQNNGNFTGTIQCKTCANFRGKSILQSDKTTVIPTYFQTPQAFHICNQYVHYFHLSSFHSRLAPRKSGLHRNVAYASIVLLKVTFFLTAWELQNNSPKQQQQQITKQQKSKTNDNKNNSNNTAAEAAATAVATTSTTTTTTKCT